MQKYSYFIVSIIILNFILVGCISDFDNGACVIYSNPSNYCRDDTYEEYCDADNEEFFLGQSCEDLGYENNDDEEDQTGACVYSGGAYCLNHSESFCTDGDLTFYPGSSCSDLGYPDSDDDTVSYGTCQKRDRYNSTKTYCLDDCPDNNCYDYTDIYFFNEFYNYGSCNSKGYTEDCTVNYYANYPDVDYPDPYSDKKVFCKP